MSSAKSCRASTWWLGKKRYSVARAVWADFLRERARPIFRVVACLLLVCPSLTEASDVFISIVETRTSEQTNYIFDVATSTLSKTQAIAGGELPPIKKYVSRHEKLYSSDTVLADADEVLFQCEVEGVDLVVVRDEYNSFSNPIRILCAERAPSASKQDCLT